MISFPLAVPLSKESPVGTRQIRIRRKDTFERSYADESVVRQSVVSFKIQRDERDSSCHEIDDKLYYAIKSGSLTRVLITTFREALSFAYRTIADVTHPASSPKKLSEEIRAISGRNIRRRLTSLRRQRRRGHVMNHLRNGKMIENVK